MKTPAFIDTLRAHLPPLPRAFRPGRPLVAVELSDHYLAAARAGKPDSSELGAYFCAELPEGSVRSSPVHQNLLSKDKLVPLIRAAKARIAPNGAQIALCLPDVIVRTAIISANVLPKGVEKVREQTVARLIKATAKPAQYGFSQSMDKAMP